jgi:hypothetical protein
MLHLAADIIFAVDPARGLCDGQLRHNFRDEHDAPANFTIHSAPYVKTKIDLFKLGVKGNGNLAAELCVAEPEAHQAYVALFLKGVEFGSCGHKSVQAGRINFVVEHEQFPPLGGEKDFFRVRHLQPARP